MQRLRALRAFGRLSAAERRFHLAVWARLLLARLLLWLLPFRRIQAWLERRESAGSRPATSDGERAARLQRILRAHRRVKRFVPRATCLVNALCVHTLCLRAGLPSELVIGVKHDPAGAFAAHAWVRSGDRVIVGGLSDLDRYVELPPLNTAKTARAPTATPSS